MATLLVLGSKPFPCLPRAGAFDAVACANASVASAARLQLPVPEHTAVSALITNNSELGRRQLQVLQGLSTRTLFYVPHRIRGGTVVKRLGKRLRNWRLRPPVLKWSLHRVGFRYQEFVSHGPDFYRDLAVEHAAADHALIRQLHAKSPSTGVIALLIGLADGRFDRFIMAGFSFERTQAFAAGGDPPRDARGRAVVGLSRHAATDLPLLRRLGQRHPRILTTEPQIAELTGLPLMPERARNGVS